MVEATPCNRLENFCPLKDRLKQDLVIAGNGDVTVVPIASASGTTCAYKADGGNNVCVYSNPSTDADTCTLSLTSGNVACPSHIGDAPPNECPFTNRDVGPLIGSETVLGSQLCTYLDDAEADAFEPCNYQLSGPGTLFSGPAACPGGLGGPPPAPRSAPSPRSPAGGFIPIVFKRELEA
ncbi:hypothetical protein C8R46DRAFT_1351699 [Mycena filopes]|nr:hypothetical protein C8R46DRAFT_1351699 [Mycena filopes]